MFYHTAVPVTTEEVPLGSVATTQNADHMYETVPDMDYLEPVLSALNPNKNENVEPASEYQPMAPGKIAPNQYGVKNTQTDKSRKQKNECGGNQKHQSEVSQTCENITLDVQNWQMGSRNLTVEDDKPYDLSVAGYLNPSSASIYTKLNVNRQK